ncbi:MAG: DUF924 domain-containing protein [Pseudomonadales bacterium]|jgi:uncharacterized protein (DUF924 family)|nr:DUF924 domain-containing protein [Pseudomonadales bacterium]
MQTDPAEIIDYWLGTDQLSVESMKRQWKLWYSVNTETDNTIRERFGDALHEAESGNLEPWQATPDGSLALVILLDQFTRNLYRGTPDAWRNDTKALAVAEHAINTGQHLLLSVPGRIMLYHPYHHAEDARQQQKAVTLFSELKAAGGEIWEDEVENHLSFVRGHAKIVETFGRFPHRNQILGRVSTTEEQAHLEKDSRAYGQE